MKLLFGIGVLIACAYFAGAPLIDDLRGNTLSALSVFSGINPKSAEDTILAHYNSLVPGFDATRDSYELVTIVDYVDADERKDIIAILNADTACGTGGCLASIFLQDEFREFMPTEFNYTVKSIELLDTYTNDMRDLRINNDTSHHLIWSGSAYILEEALDSEF